MPSAAFHIETGNNASQPADMMSMPTLMSNDEVRAWCDPWSGGRPAHCADGFDHVVAHDVRVDRRAGPSVSTPDRTCCSAKVREGAFPVSGNQSVSATRWRVQYAEPAGESGRRSATIGPSETAA